jgi:hypothetical protein
LKDSDESTAENERELVVDKLVEEDFDAFFLANQAKVADFVTKGTYDTLGKQWIKTEFKLYIKNHKLNNQIDLRKDDEIKSVIDATTFQLEDLKEEIDYLKAHNEIKTQTADLKKEINGEETNEKAPDLKNTYGYKPEKFAFQELGAEGKINFDYDDIDAPLNDQKILNIYKKGGLHKEISKILGDL